jgi:hemin uptake protein HemP
MMLGMSSPTKAMQDEPHAVRHTDSPHRSQQPKRWSSRDLLAGRHEVEIEHNDSIYRLRLTSLGKLILTK